MKHIDKISDYLKDKADTVDRINKILGEPYTNNSSETKQKFEELKKELEMATNRENVRQFIDLLLNGETIENAAKVSGIGDMKLADVLKTISEMEKIKDSNKTISKEEYEDLLDRDRKLSALEAGGVDNWEWYGESLAQYYNEEE